MYSNQIIGHFWQKFHIFFHNVSEVFCLREKEKKIVKLNSYIYFFIIKFGVLNWSHWEKRNDNNRGRSWIVVVNIQSSRWGRREEDKIKQLWGTLRSHQCVSQAGTGCCRSAERHRFCRERKSVSLAMPQINLLALPNLSSPYSLRHSTMCKEACICLQRPAMFQKSENEMAGLDSEIRAFFFKCTLWEAESSPLMPMTSAPAFLNFS